MNVISRSPTNANPVFERIVESASRLCGETFSVVWKYDGDLLHYAASHNFTPQVLDRILKTYPKRPDRTVAAGRAILDRGVAHVADMLADPDYAHDLAIAGNWRASIAVPMLQAGKPVGAISVGKPRAEPFSDSQIQLLSTFADQAVIAIENARLFEEVQSRSRELQQALDYQTATSEVLNVISRSPSKLQPVLDTIVNTASRLCEAFDVLIVLRDGDFLRNAAHIGEIPVGFEEWPINRGWLSGRAVMDLKPIHVHDLTTPEMAEEFPDAHAMALRLGHPTILSVPLVQENLAIGALTLRRTEVRPFSQKQIALLQTFRRSGGDRDQQRATV